MWLWLAIASAFLLGTYDVAKKKALKYNGVLHVLLAATAMSALFLSPFLRVGPLSHHLELLLKAVLVTTSWVSGMIGLKLLPLTTVSTIKGSRPVLVVLFSIILFGERLNGLQWTGVALALVSLYMLSGTSKKEGIDFSHNKGIVSMVISVFSGVASALYDKYIMAHMEPIFVQSWSNVNITLLLALIVALKAWKDGEQRERFSWDWRLLLIAVLITASDFIYFFALKDPDAMLSVISVLRRSSILITFVLGAVLFKEKYVREKTAAMLTMLVGVGLLVLASA